MANLLFTPHGQSLIVNSDIQKIVENSIQYLTYKIDYSNWLEDLSNNEELKDIDLKNLSVFPIFNYDGKEYKGAPTSGIVPTQVIRAPGFVVHLVGKILHADNSEAVVITTERIAVKIHGTGSLNSDNKGEIPVVAPTWADNLEIAITNNATEISMLEKAVTELAINQILMDEEGLQ